MICGKGTIYGHLGEEHVVGTVVLKSSVIVSEWHGWRLVSFGHVTARGYRHSNTVEILSGTNL